MLENRASQLSVNNVLCHLWQEWQHISIQSCFPMIIQRFEDTCGSPGMLKNRPTHQILQFLVSTDLWHLWQELHYISIASFFPKIVQSLVAALACLKIYPPIRYWILQLSVTRDLWHLWQEWQYIYIASFFPKIVLSPKDTCGSPGMLENRPTHQILQLSVGQSVET